MWRTLVGKNLRETARRQIRNYIQNNNMTAFAEAEVVSDFQARCVDVWRKRMALAI